MEIEHLELADEGVRGHLQSGVLTPPSFLGSDRQVEVAAPENRESAEGRIAVASFSQGHIVTDRVEWIACALGDLLGEVEFSGAWSPLVDLLKKDDVGIVVLEDLDDPLGTEATIDTDSAMNVVAQHAKMHEANSSGSWIRILRRFVLVYLVAWSEVNGAVGLGGLLIPGLAGASYGFEGEVSEEVEESQVRGWRDRGTGLSPGGRAPRRWSDPSTLVWKTPLPGSSNASPVVLGDRVFVTAEPYLLLCLDRADGVERWRKSHDYQELGLSSRPPRTHRATGYSTPTPTSDGDRVFALFGNGVLASYFRGGARDWIRLVDRPPRAWGHSSSPLLLADRLVVHVSELVALSPSSRRIAWRTPSPPRWGSPVSTRIGGEDVILTCGGQLVRARDGRILAERLGDLKYNSPVIVEGTAYFVDADAKAYELPREIPELKEGQLLSLPKRWRTRIRTARYYSSPLVFEDRVYAVDASGRVNCLDAASGKKVWSDRLSSPVEEGEKPAPVAVFSSLTLAGDLLLVASESGVCWLLRPGDRFEVVAVNRIGSLRSCPVFSGGRLYLRTEKALWCLEEKTRENAEEPSSGKE